MFTWDVDCHHNIRIREGQEVDQSESQSGSEDSSERIM